MSTTGLSVPEASFTEAFRGTLRTRSWKNTESVEGMISRITSASKVRMVVGLAGSSETTWMDFRDRPRKPAGLKLTSTSVLSPGARVHLPITVEVQPQEGFSRVMFRGAWPVLVTLKRWETLASPEILPKSKWVASKLMCGAAWAMQTTGAGKIRAAVR